MASRVGRGLALGALLVAVWLGIDALTGPKSIIIDGGQYPLWVLSQYSGDGGLTVHEPPLWEYLLPWHWGAEEVCVNCLETP